MLSVILIGPRKCITLRKVTSSFVAKDFFEEGMSLWLILEFNYGKLIWRVIF